VLCFARVLVLHVFGCAGGRFCAYARARAHLHVRVRVRVRVRREKYYSTYSPAAAPRDTFCSQPATLII